MTTKKDPRTKKISAHELKILPVAFEVLLLSKLFKTCSTTFLTTTIVLNPGNYSCRIAKRMS